jgi:GNAT superfamily N-acetyltransferase
MGHEESIAELEASAERAFIAEEIHRLGPWRFRYSRGVFHRANSVATCALLDHSHKDASKWDDLIAAAENFYRQRELPTIFHLTDAPIPADLDERLERRGYHCERLAEVWSADARMVAAKNSTVSGDFREVFETSAADGWLSCAFGEDGEKRKIKAQFFNRIQTPKVFVSMCEGDQVVASGLGVEANNRVWIFSMQTQPSHQRRGLASKILTQIAEWALGKRVERIHLQVMADNVPATALYRRAGFTRTYGYHYRVKQ